MSAGAWALVLSWPVLALMGALVGYVVSLSGVPLLPAYAAGQVLVFGGFVGLWHYVKH